MPVRSLVTPDTPLALCPTNLNLADPREAALAVACSGAADITLDKTGRATLKATRYLIFGEWIQREDDGGSDPVVYVALLTADGRIFKTSSVYAPSAVRRAGEVFSQSEWDAGITWVITEVKTVNNRLSHNLRVLIDSEDLTGPAT
jgi:hypothetical protein